MSKERIEEIKSMYENWLTSSHMGWLIEQAKRAQKLEERLNALITLKKSDANAMGVLMEQNKRYREAYGHMKRIILHPFSKTINKDETLYKIETILRALEDEE